LRATCSSLRLAAKPSAVPVAERAQRKLMHELEFINPQQSAPDAPNTLTCMVLISQNRPSRQSGQQHA
jgi:hypothetical protein